MNKMWMVAIAGCIGVTAVTLADEVLFKSGDRLTGTVKSMADGKMLFDSKVAGPVVLKMADIETFSTDEPIKIALTDGTIVKYKISVAEDGHVAIDADQPLSFDSIDKLNPKKPAWKGVITTGATFVRGNTKSDSASVGIEAARRSEAGRITLGAGYYTARQRDNSTRSNSTTADNWFMKGQYDYFISEKLYGYGNGRYERDRLTNLEMRMTPSLGLGYQWIERADFNFSTEIGMNWLYERYQEPDETRTYTAGRLAYHIDRNFNDYVKAFHNFEYLLSTERMDTYLVNADVGLRAALTAYLSLEAKAQLAYNSKPADDRDNKYLRYFLGVGWTF
jgi:putative salt-induced outer membrane protein YdiY